MAIHAHSTIVSAFQLGLLRPALTDATPVYDFSPAAIMARADGYVADQACRTAARPAIDNPRTADELLEEIAREIGGRDRAGTVDAVATNHASALASESVPADPLADPESTAVRPCNASRLASEGALASTALLPVPAPLPSLTTALSRRRAIFGAVALAAAPVAIVPAAAVAEDFPSAGMNAEAAELQAEFETTAKRHRRALERCDEADAAMIWPEIPEALFWQKSDRVLFAFSLPGQERCTGRRWWGFSDDLEALQARQLAFVNGTPIRDSRARRDEIVAADAAYRAAVADAELAAGIPAAEAEYEEAAGAFFDITDRLIAWRTDDPAIMGLKALALVEAARRQGGHEKLIESIIADDSNQAMCLGASLVRDFIGQLGAAHREAV